MDGQNITDSIMDNEDIWLNDEEKSEKEKIQSQRTNDKDMKLERFLDKALTGDIFQITNPNSPFPFLKLPAELRLCVYKALLYIDPLFVRCDVYKRRKGYEVYTCKDQHRFSENHFWQLNKPLGYYKPSTNPSQVRMNCLAENGYETGDYYHLSCNHVETTPILNMWRVNRQIYE
jgi:hypothetical protein